jgi:hypothetical protein
LTQNKKELTISSSDVDKMSIKGIFRLFYSCIFAADEFAPKNPCKILLIRQLPAELLPQVFFVLTKA